MKKNHLLLLFIFLSLMTGNTSLFGQISEGGKPFSFTIQSGLRSQKPVLEIPVDFDVAALIREDAQDKGSGVPPRIGVNIPVDLNMNNSGEWLRISDGRAVWRLSLKAEGALAITLNYDEFYIPEGGKLFIYNEDKTQLLGAYTHHTNTFGKEFATEFVSGDQLTLEYEKPLNADELDIARIAVSGIGYGYNHIQVYPVNQLRINDSGSCLVNINCSEGDNWQNQKRGVGKTTYIMSQYIYYCSGALVNNTNQDFTPYWLSAHHCFAGIDEAALNRMIFYFHYEHPACENANKQPSTTKTVVGASLLVDIPLDGMSDGILLLVNQAIPTAYGVFYNGWDRTNTPATSGVGIHHPGNDVKKISTFTTPAKSVQWRGDDGNGAKDAHWNVIYKQTEHGHSVTEGGSSGSPLFNQSGYIVGTLTGGSSSCEEPLGDNYYGKFWYHWDRSTDVTKQMKKYLAPDGNTATVLPGKFPEGTELIANFEADRTSVYASESVTFMNLSFGTGTYKWLFPGGEPASSTQKHPPSVNYNNPGVYDVTLIMNEGKENEIVKTKSRYITVTQKTGNCKEDITIAPAESGVAEFPLGIRQKQTFSSSIYKANELSNKRGEITALTWFATKSVSSLRSLSIYMKETTDENAVATTWENEIGGARLVFDGDADWFNASGENTIRLNIPFAYSGTKNLKVMVRTVAKEDQGFGGSDVRYANIPSSHIQWTATNANIPVTVGTVNANRPNIRFAMDTCPAMAPIANFSRPDTLIGEGEFIQFADLSTGPPVSWEWTFSGGSPEKSSEQNPTVSYMKKGVYDVSLTVKSNLGSDTKTYPGAITVKSYAPETRFRSGDGYVRRSNYGQYIPPRGSLYFIDNSKNKPTTWTWTFAGGAPGSSSSLSVGEVVYNTPGEYKVSLKTSNAMGSDSLSIDNYVLVGTREEKVWNMPEGDPGTSLHTFSGGNMTGSNSSYYGIAEYVDAPQSAVALSRIDIQFSVGNSRVGMLKVTLYKYDNGKLGQLITQTDLPVSSIQPTGYTTVVLPEQVGISTAFFIVVSGFETTNGLAILSSEKRLTGNSAYVYKDGNVSPMTDYYPFGLSLNVVPELMYSVFDVQASSSYNKGNHDISEETIVVTANVRWNATTPDAWLIITNGSKDGSGSFSFSCTENQGGARTGSIFVKGGGVEKEIIVNQSGPEAHDLKAERRLNGLVNLSWKYDQPKLLHTTTDQPDYTFNIYRNNEQIESKLTALEYVDSTAISSDSCCYTVGVLYKNGTESSQTKAVCVSPFVGSEENSILVYPNPVEDILNVQSIMGIRQVQVIDANGKIVYMDVYKGETTVMIPVSQWSKGTYIVAVDTEKSKAKHKVVKK